MGLIDHHVKNAGGTTRKKAINAMCCLCMGHEPGKPIPPGLSADIKHCPSKTCPLYEWRPYKQASER